VKTLLSRVLEGYCFEKKTIGVPPLFVEKHLGLSDSRTPFEVYVPGLLVFSAIMLIFSSSMAVVKEIEYRTLGRLKMAPVTTLELLAGMGAVQVSLGILSVFLTFLFAIALGFRSAGSIFFAFVISGITCFACVGIGMVVASISRSQTRAFLVSSVAMFMLLLFSGVIFPRPDVLLFEIGGYAIRLFDFLPTTHMGKGLEKVLTFGASPMETLYETGLLVFLAFFYFGTGVMIFNRTGKSLP
jgi:ABC-2 type transport system permease protein